MLVSPSARIYKRQNWKMVLKHLVIIKFPDRWKVKLATNSHLQKNKLHEAESAVTGITIAKLYAEKHLLKQAATIWELKRKVSFTEAKVTELKKNVSFFYENCPGDIIFVGWDKEPVIAHCFIMASNSTVFQRMFSIDMKERRTGIVDIPDARASALRSMVGYCYTMEVQFTEDASAEELLKLADRYDIRGLREQCEKILYTGINFTNLRRRIELARVYEISGLAVINGRAPVTCLNQGRSDQKGLLSPKVLNAIPDDAFFIPGLAVINGRAPKTCLYQGRSDQNGLLSPKVLDAFHDDAFFNPGVKIVKIWMRDRLGDASPKLVQKTNDICEAFFSPPYPTVIERLAADLSSAQRR
ncbi:hypothetical protein R1sor_000628 [Riccia sorocarpa]|uniref:BTB domain-containing protein n=1 Tax=Riccia sorocarpa TaxID=122646 RepID=A0ABD3GVK5_9MARC